MLKIGTHVKLKSKKILLKELGKDWRGYPRTTASFNWEGGMDHCFEASAVITDSYANSEFLTLTFDTEIPGFNYDWTFTPDMLEEL